MYLPLHEPWFHIANIKRYVCRCVCVCVIHACMCAHVCAYTHICAHDTPLLLCDWLPLESCLRLYLRTAALQSVVRSLLPVQLAQTPAPAALLARPGASLAILAWLQRAAPAAFPLLSHALPSSAPMLCHAPPSAAAHHPLY